MVQPYDGTAGGSVDGAGFIHGMDGVLASLNASVIRTAELELENSYYDTPDLALYRAGIALRVRKTGSETEGTIKTRRMSSGGIHVHPEYNVPLSEKPDVPDLRMFPEHIFAEIDVDAVQKELYENMAQNCRRHIWLVSFMDAEIELSFDRVAYKTTDGGTVAGTELELELKKGGVTALQKFAGELTDAVYAGRIARFRPESLSKMHRAAIYAGISELKLPSGNEIFGKEADSDGACGTEKAFAGLMSATGRIASVIYLGPEGRNEETAKMALDMMWRCFRALAAMQVPANSDIFGQYAELRDILRKRISGLSEEGTSDVMHFHNLADEMAALDGILTDRDFIRVILEINFAGLRGEKA